MRRVGRIRSSFELDSTFLGKDHAYFRGRHLHGTVLPLPANYTGALLHITDKPLPQPQSRSHAQLDNDRMDDDDEEEAMVDVKIAEQVGDFEEVVVWGHAGEVEKGKDAFVRGLEEWVSFAEAIW
jgi:ribonuclease H2 subunit C